MDSQINRIYIGLPAHLKDKIYWVTRPYRTNPLSHIPGGTDVIMEYHNGQVLGYDWIKDPFSYIRAMSVISECWSMGDDPNVISIHFDTDKFKTLVSGIFIRKYKAENYRTIRFEKIWDSATSVDSPLKGIDSFLMQEYL